MTLALNREAAFEVIAHMDDQAPEVAAGLREMVDNFQMAELQKLLEKKQEYSATCGQSRT